MNVTDLTLTPLKVGPTMNAAFCRENLVVIQNGNYPRLDDRNHGILRVLAPETGKDGHVTYHEIGMIDYLGSTRQIVIEEDIAYITSREDGLFIVDLSDPTHPTLLCHYETTEYATGISLANHLLVISMRDFGLELIDVSDPSHPRFIGIVDTGEAQSVWIDDHYVYAGVWGSRELVIADISDPANGKVVARVPLDGRGDGVIVRDHLCYAATGHHARPPKGIEHPDPSTYEQKGNGLEIYDVSDPSSPQKIGGIKFPDYYGLTFDMWSVQLSGDLALVSDTRNGFFFVNVADPTQPVLLGRVLLPPPLSEVTVPWGDTLPMGAISGFTFQGNQLMIAGAQNDTYQLELPEDLGSIVRATSSVSATCSQAPLQVEWMSGQKRPIRQLLEKDHVRSVCYDDKRVFVAVSSAGIRVLDKETLTEIDHISTIGSVNTVQCYQGYLYTAEGMDGFGVYREKDGHFVSVFHEKPYRRAIFDLMFSGDHRYLLLQCCSVGVLAYDLSDPAHPKMQDADIDYIGLFYGRHFPSLGWNHQCFLAVNRDGLFHLQMENGKLTRTHMEVPCRFGFSSGTGLEVIGDQLLVNKEDHYYLCPLGTDPYRIENTYTRTISGLTRQMGKPRYRDGLLVLTHRSQGIVTLCDASDLYHIQSICQFRLNAAVDLACLDENRIYLPGARQGLLVLER